jgi:hypothetical protein
MNIPLEDNFNDILGKACRGLGLADEQLAQQTGLTTEIIAAMKDGRQVGQHRGENGPQSDIEPAHAEGQLLRGEEAGQPRNDENLQRVAPGRQRGDQPVGRRVQLVDLGEERGEDEIAGEREEGPRRGQNPLARAGEQIAAVGPPARTGIGCHRRLRRRRLPRPDSEGSARSTARR